MSAEPATPLRASRADRVRWYHWLAALPAVGMLGGIPWVNRVHPLVLGLPLLFAWLVGWVLVTSAVMALILFLDRQRGAASDAGTRRS
jgi:hypothetical protein